MKSGFLLLVCWLAAFSLAAQSFDARIAQSKKPFSEIKRTVMPPLNNEALRAADVARVLLRVLRKVSSFKSAPKPTAVGKPCPMGARCGG
jgi:hypothetical protein